MRRSKLEMYSDILKVLSQKKFLKVTHIIYKANINCKILKDALDFLIKQGLIEKRVIGSGTLVYASTPHGTEILKFFREIEKMLPLLKEEEKIVSLLS